MTVDNCLYYNDYFKELFTLNGVFKGVRRMDEQRFEKYVHADKISSETAGSISPPLNDNEQENKKSKRISLIKTAAIVLSVIFVIFISTFSWFTMSRETETNDMAMIATDLPFDIATSGSGIRNDVLLGEVRPEYENGTVSGDYHIAYNTTENLKLRYNTGGSADIKPGGNGELSLYVIPKTNTAVNVKLTLNVSAFASVPKKDDDGNVLYKKNSNDQYILDTNGNRIVDTEAIEVTSATDFASAVTTKTRNSVVANDASSYVTAANYLRGHILFFGCEGDTATGTPSADRYYYTTPYTDRIIETTIPDNKMNTPVQVPIYWMWTDTFGQIALPDNTSEQRKGYPILADSNTTDKNKIKTYLINNSTSIFANNDENTVPYINEVTSTVTTPQTFNSTAFSNLSKGYNQADNIIGTKISYFIIEVTVEQG